MRISSNAALLALTLCLATASAAMAQSAKIPAKGLLKSGSASGTGTTPVNVLVDTADPTTAAGSDKVFILTQACFQIAASNTVTLTAGTLTIPFTFSNSNSGTGCVSFSPGFLVPEGVTLTCAATGTAAFSCTVSGIVAKAA